MEAGTLTARRSLGGHLGVRAGALAAAPLAAITVLGAVLRLWAFGQVPANAFYDAAVRSMSLSWHNFFFGAFEPSAQVAVDKAPADLWLQVASVKLFGFSTTATRLPEVAAGILAIPLLYDLVRRLFGRRAGLGAAAAMAVLPAAILTAHSDTMDSVMMLLDVLAAWLVVVGAQSRKVWPVVAAGAALGLAFNVKLFEALIVLPALALLVLVAVDLPARRRALAIGGSVAAFVGVSLSWIAAASLTPLGHRPYPIGSSNGSIWDVVFGFNGIDRLRTQAAPGALAFDPPGLLRFFRGSGPGYATTVGTMLLPALVFGAIAVALALARRRRGASIDRLQLAGAVFLGTWLVFGVGLLSYMQRLAPRYLEAVTPAIAAVLGVGLARVVAAMRPRRGLFAAALVAVLAAPAAGAVTVAHQHRSDAGIPLRTTPRLLALSRYLRTHQGGARYEVASASVGIPAPLIVHDARPVLMLTSLKGRPLLDAARLRGLVSTGQVRYALLGRGSKGPSAVHWARTHARDVSRAAGQRPGTLYRLSATPARRQPLTTTTVAAATARTAPPARSHRG
jgi:4-amino-4-deoxy-L-arabinose transferase-like glycosyltransferase